MQTLRMFKKKKQKEKLQTMAFSYVLGFLNHNFHHYSFPTYGLK